MINLAAAAELSMLFLLNDALSPLKIAFAINKDCGPFDQKRKRTIIDCVMSDRLLPQLTNAPVEETPSPL